MTELLQVAPSTEIRTDKQFVVLIPAYEPGAVLLEVVDAVMELAQSTPGFAGVIVVNDGSKREEALGVFEHLRLKPGVKLVTHSMNRGKGGALKTGFDIVYREMPDVDFVVTADADGQHTPVDIFRVATQACETGLPNIGYRTFTNEVPLRSRVGNILTATLFSLTTGNNIKDTQSGLRTYRRADLPTLCKVAADRYEFEFHCLFHLARTPGVKFDQIPIETVYEPGNPTSHFNPLLDSARIYAVFFRYMSVSAISGSLDFLLFSLFATLGAPTIVGLVSARVITAPIYILGMRNFAFRSRGNLLIQALGTISLMVCNILFLWRFIDLTEVYLGLSPPIAMLAGLLVFYLGNFLVQRFLIYPLRSKVSVGPERQEEATR